MLTSTFPRSVSYGPNTAAAAPPDAVSSRRESIERRAFGIWLAKGRPRDTALQDWLEAEVEIDRESDMNSWSYIARASW